MSALLRLAALASLMTATMVADGQEPTSGGPAGFDARAEAPRDATGERIRELWLLSVEGVTRAPIDVGAQATLLTPVGVRVMGTYGVMPSGYANALTNIASSYTDDVIVESVLDNLTISGTVWRVGAGIQPIRRIGLYLDAGYARANLDGELALSSTEIEALSGVEGAGSVSSRLDLWFFEVGYQRLILERALLGIGAGAMGTMSAETDVAGSGSPSVRRGIAEAEAVIDDAFETYGFVPTLSLRLGVDLI